MQSVEDSAKKLEEVSAEKLEKTEESVKEDMDEIEEELNSHTAEFNVSLECV